MKSAKNDLTLKNIAKVIDEVFDRKFDQKFAPVNSQLTSLNTKVVGIYGELDDIKQQAAETNLDVKILRKEVKEGFDTVFEGITNLGESDPPALLSLVCYIA